MMKFYTTTKHVDIIMILMMLIVMQGYVSFTTALSRIVPTTNTNNDKKSTTSLPPPHPQQKQQQSLSSYQSHLKTKIASSIAKGERRANQRSVSERILCTNCKRPPSICVCTALPLHNKLIELQTRVLILQHPNEFRRKTISTSPLLPLVLKECQIKVGYTFQDIESLPWIMETLSTSTGEGQQRPLLLFPGPDSLSIDDGYHPSPPSLPTTTTTGRNHQNISSTNNDNKNNNSEIHDRKKQQDDDRSNNDDDDASTTTSLIPSSLSSSPSPEESSSFTTTTTTTPKKNLLIILDGTWSQASRMARDSPNLIKACQKIQFTTPGNSIYDAIRKEPEEHCLSSLECCVQTLTLLEPNNEKVQEATTHLLDALQLLVNQQLHMKRLFPDPRHVQLRKMKQIEKTRRRVEIENKLFPSSTITTTANTTTNDDDDHIKDTKQQNSPSPPLVIQLEDGSTLRKLRHSDALQVHQKWEQQKGGDGSGGTSPLTSSDSITRRIDQGMACFGIIRGHDLCAFVLQYENGILGMLYVDEAYRQRGYGTLLVQMATTVLEEHDMECVAFILDGNTASETVFTRCGWIRENPHQKRGTGRRRAPRKWIRPHPAAVDNN